MRIVALSITTHEQTQKNDSAVFLYSRRFSMSEGSVFFSEYLLFFFLNSLETTTVSKQGWHDITRLGKPIP